MPVHEGTPAAEPAPGIYLPGGGELRCTGGGELRCTGGGELRLRLLRRVEQLPYHRGVVLQRGPTAVGQGDRGPRGDAAAVLVGAHVPGVLELAQVGDQVARREPDQFLQAGKGEVVAVIQRGQRYGDTQPGRSVDNRVEFIVAHARCSTGSKAPASKNARPPASEPTAQIPTGPANAPPAATATSQTPRAHMAQSSRMALPAR